MQIINSKTLSNRNTSSDYRKTSFGYTWTCRKCGDKNLLNNSYCKGCGVYKPLDAEIDQIINSRHNLFDPALLKNKKEDKLTVGEIIKGIGGIGVILLIIIMMVMMCQLK